MTPLAQDLIALTIERSASDPAPTGPLRDALWDALAALGWAPTPHAHRADGRPPATRSDKALLDAFVRGSPHAFDTLVARHGGALLTFAQRTLPPADASDAVQDAFIALFHKAPSILAKPEQEVRAFLFGATRLGLLDAQRKRVRAEHALGSYARQPVTETAGLDPLANILAREDRQRLVETLERACTPLEQDVIVLVLDGRTNTQIAQVLDLPRNHIGVLKHRARTKLERALAR